MKMKLETIKRQITKLLVEKVENRPGESKA